MTAPGRRHRTILIREALVGAAINSAISFAFYALVFGGLRALGAILGPAANGHQTAARRAVWRDRQPSADAAE